MKRQSTYVQCISCGRLHLTDVYIKTEDLYIDDWCPTCRDGTRNLVLSDNPDDIYMLYDVNNDFRFYDYRTK